MAKKGKGFGEAAKSIKDFKKELIKFETKLKGSNKTYELGLPVIGLNTDLGGLKDLVSFLKEFPKAFRAAHAKTMVKVAADLKTALDESMESPSWDWNGETRDIIDTGALRDSGRVTYNQGIDQIEIEYGEEYAAIVHYGGIITSGYDLSTRITYPARPWISAVLEGGYGVPRFNIEKVYSEYFIDILIAEIG